MRLPTSKWGNDSSQNSYHWARRRCGNCFSKKTVTCIHLQPPEWPQVTACDHKWNHFAKSTTCSHLQSLERPQETASDRCSKWPQVTVCVTACCGHRKCLNIKRHVKTEGGSTPKPCKELTLKQKKDKEGDLKRSRDAETKSGDLKPKRHDLNWEWKGLKRKRSLWKEWACGKRKRKELSLKRKGTMWNKTETLKRKGVIKKGGMTWTKNGKAWNEKKAIWNETGRLKRKGMTWNQRMTWTTSWKFRLRNGGGIHRIRTCFEYSDKLALRFFQYSNRLAFRVFGWNLLRNYLRFPSVTTKAA